MTRRFWTIMLDRRTALAALAAAGAKLLGRQGAPVMASQTNSSGSRGPSAASAGDNLPRSWNAKSRDRLLRLLNGSGFSGQIPAAEVKGLVESEGRSAETLMVELLPLAQTYARPPISNFRVGAVVRGTSGSLYLGANFEVPGQALGFSVHAEQSALSNAYMHNEEGVASIAVTAAPCGHCRQFMNELSPQREIQVLVAGKPAEKLSSLLPKAFGPKDLGLEHGAFPLREVDLKLPAEPSDDVTRAALAAARRSYAPYTKAHSGVSVQVKQGRVYSGAYIENAAFNPSLPPLETALVALVVAGGNSPDISRAVLVEIQGAAISQRAVTETVLGAVAPAAKLEVVAARIKT